MMSYGAYYYIQKISSFFITILFSNAFLLKTEILVWWISKQNVRELGIGKI
jgi:hypothetical protein